MNNLISCLKNIQPSLINSINNSCSNGNKLFFTTITNNTAATTTTTPSRKTPLDIKLKESKDKLKQYRNIITLGVDKNILQSLKENVNIEKAQFHDQIDKEHRHYVSFEKREDASKFYNSTKNYLIKIIKEREEERKRVHQLEAEEERMEKEKFGEIEYNEMKKSLKSGKRFSKKSEWALKEDRKKWRTIPPSPWVSVISSSIDPIFPVDKHTILNLPVPEININSIKVVDNENQVEDAIKLLLNGKLSDQLTEDDNITLGFDCEWPGLSKYLVGQNSPVSLIVLSNGEHHVVFRICNIGLKESDELGKLLLNPLALKTGFGTGKDANKIKDGYGLLMNGVFDMSYSPKIISSFSGTVGIVKAAAGLYDVNLQRNRTLTLSNWSSSQGLTLNQTKSVALYALYSYKSYFLLPTLNVDLFNYKDNSYFKGGLINFGMNK